MGSWRKVRTQAELDKVLAAGDWADIDSKPGSWLEVAPGGRARAWGNSNSPHPAMTHTYCDPKRYVAVKVRVRDLVPIGEPSHADKCKAKSCVVLYECDQNGVELAVERAAS